MKYMYLIITAVIAILALVFGYLKMLVGFVLTLFLPGYLLSLIILRKSDFLERIGMSVVLSFAVVVGLGFLLSFIGNLTATKAITEASVYVSLVVICGVFGLALIKR